MLHDQGLKGHNFTHTEIKQHSLLLEFMTEYEMAECRIATAKAEVNHYKDALNGQIDADTFDANEYDSAIIANDAMVAALQEENETYERKKAAKLIEADTKRALLETTDREAAQLSKFVEPILKIKLSRLQATALGMITKNNHKAAKKAEGKPSSRNGRDKGIFQSLDGNGEMEASEITFANALQGLLHTAKGNRDARFIVTSNDIDSGAFTDSQLNHIIANAQAAKTAMAQQA